MDDRSNDYHYLLVNGVFAMISTRCDIAKLPVQSLLRYVGQIWWRCRFVRQLCR
ncbi:hypothetical protein GGE17_007133 [Rhizobium leguminosarum]|nr:hypothetical protein [Rhizobium leguminosarum]